MEKICAGFDVRKIFQLEGVGKMRVVGIEKLKLLIAEHKRFFEINAAIARRQKKFCDIFINSHIVKQLRISNYELRIKEKNLLAFVIRN
jgi:hypothetical protein